MTFEEWLTNLSKPAESAHNFLNIPSRIRAASPQSPVLSNSKLVGSEAAGALQADLNYMNLRNSGNKAAAEKALAENPVTGCAMILSLAQRASGFNPADPAQAGNLSGFQNYLNQLLQCPVLMISTNDIVNITWQDDWGTMVDNILGYFQGIAQQDLNVIRDSLWTIAKAAASNPNTNQTDNLFVQSTINADGGVRIYIYKSFVQMRMDKHKGSGKNAPTHISDNAAFQLYRTILNFDHEKWETYHKTVMSQTNASLSSWLDDNTTPRGVVPVNWDC